MSAEMTLLKATIDAWAINAKREKEAADCNGAVMLHTETGKVHHQYIHWEAQEIAFKRVQELLTKAGVV